MKMKNRNGIRNQKGFSLIEIIIAVAILGIVSVSIVLAMTSSSKVYSKSSVEAQMQSEAELVSNAISELAIDASDALDEATAEWQATLTATDSTKIGDYDLAKGRILILKGTENVGTAAAPDYRKVEYVVASRLSAPSPDQLNCLYQAKRMQDADEHWQNFTGFFLLGNHIVNFTVNTDGVEQKNLLEFELGYEKTGKSYDGKYQVMMRNKAYAKNEAEEVISEGEIKLSAAIQPRYVYLAVKEGAINEYYEGAVVDTPEYKKSMIIPPTFRTTHVTNQAESLLHSHWSCAGGTYFALANEIADTDESSGLLTTNQLQVKATGDELYSNAVKTEFNVNYHITTQTKEGTTKSSPKAVSTVRLLRITGMTLNATSGFASKWNDDWDGTPTDGAQGYAYTDASGRVIPMNLNAMIDCTDWIPYKGGVDWELEKSDGASWQPCTNANFAKLEQTTTPTSTMNTLNFGTSAMNGQLYRITAKSKFDPKYKATLIVGVARTGSVSGDGFYSRGFYVDLTSWLEQIKGVTTTVDHISNQHGHSSGCPSKQADTTGGNWEGANVEFKKQNGRILIYVNYDSFSYSNAEQRIEFYRGGGGREFYMHDADGNTIKDATGQELIKYNMGKVVVTKMTHTGGVLVIPMNATKTVKVQTKYYNLIDSKYFGIYVDDVDTNINRSGASGTNKSLTVETASAYGDVYTYVDNMAVAIKAKKISDYNPYPIRVRLAARDYYELTRNGSTNPATYETESYTDYVVYVANVEGSDVFIPGPNTKGDKAKIDGVGLEWPAGVGSTKVDIDGYDSTGAVKKKIAKVYTQGGKTKLDYNGTTYTYSKTYNCWKK